MLGRWKKNTGTCFYRSDDLIKVMDRSGISKALVFGSHAKFSQIEDGNSKLTKDIGGCERLLPCAVALPHHTKEFMDPGSFAGYLKSNDIRAVRIFPEFHGVSLYTWLWEDLFSRLETARIPVFIDLSLGHWSQEVDWGKIHDLCVSFPKLPFVMVRMGVKTDRYIYPLFGKFENLHIETSYYLVNNGIENMVRNFGSGRLLFGTGMPVYKPEPPMKTLEFADITDEDKRMIAGENLMKLLKGAYPE